MENKLPIPAVALARAIEAIDDGIGWAVPETSIENLTNAALEAAAPYLRAQGVEHAIKRLEELVGVQKDEAQWKLIFDWLTSTAWTLQYGTEKGESK